MATATAVIALAVTRRAGAAPGNAGTLIDDGISWLLTTVNADGGWGDTPDSVSNVSTTALVWSALAFSDRPEAAAAAARGEAWIARAAGSAAPEQLARALAARYGKDRTFSVPILTACALAGRLGPDEHAWALVPQLPFEIATVPRRFFGALRLPVVSYALPALISMGLVRHRRRPVPVLGALRNLAAPRVLDVLTRLQPEGGGFLEATPLTSFVAMSLTGAGEAQHPVAVNSLEFLVRSVRADGSWPIDTNLATWVTTLSVNALGSSAIARMPAAERARLVDWLLGQQWTIEHPYTGAAPGGWAWTDLPGGVPDADDTAGAVLALASLAPDRDDVRRAASAGIAWLLDLQNRDGGIPTFCRGWGALPFDRSSTDITAHALRAWAAWSAHVDPRLRGRVRDAAGRAAAFLARAQRVDGAFVPMWFGNQHEPREENPVYGTSRVLAGLVTANAAWPVRQDATIARASAWLLKAQSPEGGWGGGPGVAPSIEETAVALAALGMLPHGQIEAEAARRGLAWLAAATSEGHALPARPIGLYFARLWYSEALYPVIFTAAARGPEDEP